MKTFTKKLLRDCGHGWLSVKKKELIDLGIANKITRWSYMKGNSVYLEEDCDMGVYLMAQHKRGVCIKVIHGKTHQTSPVRSYHSFDAHYI